MKILQSKMQILTLKTDVFVATRFGRSVRWMRGLRHGTGSTNVIKKRKIRRINGRRK